MVQRMFHLPYGYIQPPSWWVALSETWCISSRNHSAHPQGWSQSPMAEVFKLVMCTTSKTAPFVTSTAMRFSQQNTLIIEFVGIGWVWGSLYICKNWSSRQMSVKCLSSQQCECLDNVHEQGMASCLCIYITAPCFYEGRNCLETGFNV